jgi:hypothetical protein
MTRADVQVCRRKSTEGAVFEQVRKTREKRESCTSNDTRFERRGGFTARFASNSYASEDVRG